MKTDLGCFCLFAIPVFALSLLHLHWHLLRSDSMLNKWAQEHGYRIVRRSYRWFLRGTFIWSIFSKASIYRVTIEDEEGDQRSGWVRCGGWFWGILSDDVEVRWDD